MSQPLSAYQRRIHEQRLAKLKPTGAEAAWQPDGRFASREPQISIPVSTEAAIAELKAAVEFGSDMPWGMVALNWESAKAILDAIASR